MWSFYTLAEDSVKTQTAICINICEVHRTWLIRLLAQGQRPPVNTLWVGKCHFCSWFRTLSSWKPHLLGYALTHTQACMHTHTIVCIYTQLRKILAVRRSCRAKRYSLSLYTFPYFWVVYNQHKVQIRKVNVSNSWETECFSQIPGTPSMW